MKYLLDGILVVEGKEDVSYLSSFLEAEFVTTNGYSVSLIDLDYLNRASQFTNIIVLVDPDKAGREIEKKLKDELVKATFLSVDISRCTRGKKDGVAECEKDEVLNVLKSFIIAKKEENNGELHKNSLKIDILDSDIKGMICEHYRLGKCSNKKLITRLKTLRISQEEIDSLIEVFRSGNKS